MGETHHVAVTNGARCVDCPQPIRKGDNVVRMVIGKFRHLNCPIKENQ